MRAWDSWGVNGENKFGFWSTGHDHVIRPVTKTEKSILDREEFERDQAVTERVTHWAADQMLDLADCPCDPRRRHERLAQKVAVV